MSSQNGVDWSAARAARTAWRQADAQIPRLRALHGDLSALHDAVARNKPGQADVGPVLAELDRLGGDSDDRRDALGFLTDPLFEGDRALLAAFRHGRALTTEADDVAVALDSYVDGGDWAAVRSAVEAIVDPPDGPMAIDSMALEQVVTLVGLAIEAGRAARERGSNDLREALAAAYTGSGDPYATLEEQPIAMLPVRLETRFVDEQRTTAGDPSDLLVRVFPDQIHVDTHEEELTDDEVHWGQNFWATLWYARHPDPSVVPDDPEAEYLQRLPNRRLRELVADIDPSGFSNAHHKRYAELKERAWKQLLDRFDRERAAYVVHALEPTDDEFAMDLLTAPDPPPDLDFVTPDVAIETPVVQHVTVQESDGEGESGGGAGTTVTGLDDATVAGDLDQSVPADDVAGAPSEMDLSAVEEPESEAATDSSSDESQSEAAAAQTGAGSGTGTASDSDEETDSRPGDETEADSGDGPESLPERLPGLSFPQVPRRPGSWTQQARAALLPDRWVAVAEWDDGTGETHRTAVAGAPIREPLPAGSSPESVADEMSHVEDDAVAPEQTAWMVDFDEATQVGMGLRLNLSGLVGFDPTRGFTSLTVVGVKASRSADETPADLADLLDAHHYTHGLELLEQGTPTNNHDDPSGYAGSDDPRESMAVECVPPLVERGDRSDGDILARALAIDGDDDHVFANVENADSTQQRDARHVNSALWPATLGYVHQDLLLDNQLAGNDSLIGGAGTQLTGSRRRNALSRRMLRHDAYRRHFVRYVRGQGPFPALRVEKQPYGVLPTKATEFDLDVTVVDHVKLAQLERGEIDLAELQADGTETKDLVEAGVSPGTLVEAGADPDAVLEAGADPRTVVAGSVDPSEHVDPQDLVPDALTQDGVGLLSTSRLTRDRLADAGVPVDDLESMGVTVRDLARGEVTQEQLSEAGVTTRAVAEVVLSEEARELGITPRALERAGVTPAALVRGELSMDQVQALGLTTRAVADAVLPREARELGITPKKLEDAGISPADLVNGNVSADALETAGISTETLAEALLPEELQEAGITPEKVGEAVTLDELFNGEVGFDDLQEAGITTRTLADAALPQSAREAGITPASLEQAGITVDAVLNGTVTPEDIAEAGVTPEALAEAGVLPDALVEVEHAISELVDARLEPAELLDQGLSPQSLLDTDLDPGLLVDAGLAPKRLVDAGVDAVELVAKSGVSVADVATADVSAAKLARLGATAADLAGGDVPAQEVVKAGFTALDALEAGADALGVAKGGGRPSELRDAGVDAGTLRDAGKAAGSLKLAGYSVEELVESGYTAEELLNGGYSTRELEQAGVDTATVQAAGRAVDDLLAAGHPPADLKEMGYSAVQLREAGLNAGQLAAAGYTAGELVDAGIPPKKLAAAGVDVGELRAAGAGVDELAAGDVDPASLKDAGASAEALLDNGFDPEELLDAGFESVELEVAGVDVDALAEDVVEGDASTGDVAAAALEGIQYAVSVQEDPEQAERDLYSFSFDPAVPKLPAGETAPPADGGAGQASQTDGGVAASVPVVRPLAIDDRIGADLESRLTGLSEYWATAAAELPFAGDTDEGGLLDALKREGLSADLRQQTMVYSGESISHQDPLQQLVRTTVGTGSTSEELLRALSADGPLDPRLGHFTATDATVEEVGNVVGTSDPRSEFYRYHLNYPTQGSIKPHELVDGDVDAFVDVLLDGTLSDVAALSHRIGPDDLSIEASLFEDGEWGGLDAGGKRGRIVDGIETADDPAGFARRVLAGSSGDAPGYDKILQLGTNQAEHGDSGALRSLVRLLLQHGMLQEYVAARRRLGLAFDDLPDGWPDPAYYDATTRGPLAPLFDPAPAALSSHPNVGSMDSISSVDAQTTPGTAGTAIEPYTYADALQDAAASYTSTTSIDPRLSEFTDSLEHLRDVDPADLSRLVRQTLDLASHRLDAWWTSLATKRLFELREAQGTYDTDAGLDHEKWSGSGSDVPRATVDPALLGSMDADSLDAGAVQPSADVAGAQPVTDVGKSEVTGAETATGTGTEMGAGPSTSGSGPSTSGSEPSSGDTLGGTDVGQADVAQYDPAAIADIDLSLASDDSGGVGDSSSDDPTTDGGQSAAGPAGGAPSETVASRGQDADPDELDERVTAEPGLYVGGYGFVENLAVDSESEAPEYVHAPSQHHARTAALLRSGATAHDADEGDNPLAVDLSPERVRQGLRLVRGVRRGQSLGALLGYRFERRLHEETVAASHDGVDAPAHEINLMEHLETFRGAFPSTHGKLKRPDGSDASASERERRLAARESLDGYRLVKRWDEYPFGLSALPATDSAEYAVLDDIVAELEADVETAGDLLTAESVHQLGQANYERAGGAVGSLARGEPLPDPDVVRTPRSETGLTHRQCVLFGSATAADGASPRTAAEPALASWVGTLLPDAEAVECLATYRWTETTTDPARDEPTETERTAATTVRLSDLDLGPLDVLALFGAEREEARSELEQRLVYRLLRTRPSDPAVPVDANVELALTETATDGATSMADLLELTRSVGEVVQSARPVHAEDLAHPSDSRGEGYDEKTVETLTKRANTAQDRLFAVAQSLDEQIATLDADHTPSFDGASDGGKTNHGGAASADGGTTAQPTGRTGPGTSVPADTTPAEDPLSVENPSVTEQVTGLAESIRIATEELPLSTAESVANGIDDATVRSELSTLVETLPAGIADPDLVDAPVTVYAADGQSVSGTLGDPLAVPEVPTDRSDGDDSGSVGDEIDGQLADVEPIPVDATPVQLEASALGTASQPDASTGTPDRPTIESPDEVVDTAAIDPSELEPAVRTDVDETDLETTDEGGQSDGSADQATDGPDWSTTTATVCAWGTDGLSSFEREVTTTPSADGSFDVDMDFADVSPGTPFQVVAIVDGSVEFSASGRVVADGGVETTSQATLRNDCPTLQHLLWLADRSTLFSVTAEPSGSLQAALDLADWDAIGAERAAVDATSSSLTQADLDAVDALVQVEGLDPASLAETLEETIAPIRRLGVDTLVDLTGGEGPPADLDYWVTTSWGVGDVRARIRRTLEDPALFLDDAADRLLAYDHSAARTLHGMDDGEVVAASLDAFLAGPAWTVRYLDREIDDPAAMVQDLTAWLYSPADAPNEGDLTTSLRELADAVSALPALAALFDESSAAGPQHRLRAFEGHLRSLAAALDGTTPAVGDEDADLTTIDDECDQAATDLTTALAAERTTLTAVPDDVDRSFRTIVLEQLREPLTVAADFGVYGATPRSPVGGRPSDEASLLEQAHAVLERLRTTLGDAAALDPRVQQPLADRPVPQRVEDATDRLQTLFGDEFTVLPPFRPSNPQELTATFTDNGLLPDDQRMAAETWLQRAAAIREGVADFREARSYAEAITGTLTPSLTVGQIPYEASDTWVGVEDVQPSRGKLSLVAQFGPGAAPATADGRLTGLFVDEWTEAVPDETETTGLALDYDDPGSRAPQSVLVATPDGASWSLDELVSVVTETAAYSKRRAVDLGDMDVPAQLFPGLYFAQQTAGEPSTPTVDFRMLDWYDRLPVLELESPLDQLNALGSTGDLTGASMGYGLGTGAGGDAGTDLGGDGGSGPGDGPGGSF